MNNKKIFFIITVSLFIVEKIACQTFLDPKLITIKLNEKKASISTPIVLKSSSETKFLEFKNSIESHSHIPTSRELDSIVDLKFNSSKRLFEIS